jgi:hypothetical protein
VTDYPEKVLSGGLYGVEKTPRHGSHIAAVLKEFGIIKDSFGKKTIMLQF